MSAQDIRRTSALRTAYQTEWIFRRKYKIVEAMSKVLVFLGFAVPLSAGGIIMSLYANTKPPEILLAAAGILGTVQIVISLWGLVDGWDGNIKEKGAILREFTQLRIDVEHFRPKARGNYDESYLMALEMRASRGVHADNSFGVSDKLRQQAWQEANKRYP